MAQCQPMSVNDPATDPSQPPSKPGRRYPTTAIGRDLQKQGLQWPPVEVVGRRRLAGHLHNATGRVRPIEVEVVGP